MLLVGDVEESGVLDGGLRSAGESGRAQLGKSGLDSWQAASVFAGSWRSASTTRSRFSPNTSSSVTSDCTIFASAA